ncbi:hypothetical protein TWF281_006290 [Arthrobotrys megalospora]
MLSLPISPVPPPMPTMSRRVPLSNIQNHHGQPYSLSTATVPAKRPAKPTRDTLGPPPAKKAHLDTAYLGPDQKENRHTTPSKLVLVPKTPSRQDAVRRDAVPSRVARTKPTVATRRPVEKIDSQKYRKPVQTQPHVQKLSTRDKQLNAVIAENNEAIRAWQRHYIKVFPTLTFYLDETVSEDKMAMLRIHLRDLDSTVIDHFDEDKVTHVITARDDIPPETSKEQDAARTGTINPRLLGKTDSRGSLAPKLTIYDEQEDILVLARLNQMKIWNLEKIERMIHTLNEKIDDDYGMVVAPVPLKTLPSKYNKVEAPKAKKPSAVESTKRNEEALGRLLSQDKSRSTQPSSSKEMYVFKGPYVLVGDASGRYKHFIIREFRNVSQPENGDWPQFRSNREGRCPFVLDPDTKRAYMREEAEREAEAKAKEKEAARLKARSVMEPPPRNQSLRAKTSLLKDSRAAHVDRRPLNSIENKVDRDMATAAAATAVRKTESRLDKLKDLQRTRQDNLVLTGYEPVASGLRPTGPTSAVVSQAISSNPVLVGPKAGTSRDVQRLNRRVFEKTTGGIRQTNTTTTLQVVDEENNDAKGDRKTLKRTRSEVVVKEASKKQPVAGYCENCRDKYDDFEKHIQSKRHLRFASNDDNFLELDALLATLKRPRKQSMSPTPSY